MMIFLHNPISYSFIMKLVKQYAVLIRYKIQQRQFLCRFVLVWQ